MHILAILSNATLTFIVGYALMTASLGRFDLPPEILRFHLGLMIFLAGCVTAAVLWIARGDGGAMTLGFLLWLAVIWITAARVSRRSAIDSRFMIAVAAFTALLFLGWMNVQQCVLTPLVTASHLLSGFVLAATTYGMCLGHGYLNHPGLSFEPLRRMGRDLTVIVVFKAVFSTTMLFTQTVSFDWGTRPLYALLFTTQGLGVLLHYVFGVMMPLAGAYLVMGTIRVRSNQSATGILYVLMTAALIAEGARWVAVTRLQTAL